ncbi:hypothetical protein SLEP1_g23835 [Rubroshorea leprosula]|uniref:1-aminocyclopropane-1-carboxylate synthase n=1 Tax=Rubroshorea leprosula TaxID=152421 RepID=A0AAV5JGN7_9ROSI|nr:hypothetical protein SLEP1_g23835 [Rubroshorea leprosula]
MSRFGLVSSQSQHFLAALLSDEEFINNFLSESSRRLANRYRFLTNELIRAGVFFLESNAGLFFWMDLRPLLMEQTFDAELELWRVIVDDVKLNVSPGSSFHGLEPGWFRISHLQFADDAILFGLATEENVRAIKCIMRAFELVSGLKINYGKSMLAGINVCKEWLSKMAFILNCKQGEIPFKYLGIPVGGNPRKLAFWKPLVDSFKKKLAG